MVHIRKKKNHKKKQTSDNDSLEEGTLIKSLFCFEAVLKE